MLETSRAHPFGFSRSLITCSHTTVSERRGVGGGEGEADGADVKRGRFRTFADRARARIGARAAQVMGRERGGKDDHGVGKAQGDDVKRPGMAAAFGTLVGGPMHSVRKLAKRADSLFQGIPSPLEELIAESRKGMADALGCLPNSSAKRWRERQVGIQRRQRTPRPPPHTFNTTIFPTRLSSRSWGLVAKIGRLHQSPLLVGGCTCYAREASSI
jgi:hypothetical protein